MKLKLKLPAVPAYNHHSIVTRRSDQFWSKQTLRGGFDWTQRSTLTRFGCSRESTQPRWTIASKQESTRTALPYVYLRTLAGLPALVRSALIFRDDRA